MGSKHHWSNYCNKLPPGAYSFIKLYLPCFNRLSVLLKCSNTVRAYYSVMVLTNRSIRNVLSQQKITHSGPLFSPLSSDLFNYIDAAYAPVCPKLLHSTSLNSLEYPSILFHKQFIASCSNWNLSLIFESPLCETGTSRAIVLFRCTTLRHADWLALFVEVGS